MPSLCIASGAPVGGGTASAACAPSNAINLPGGKVAQHVKGLRLVPVALASGAAASRPARRRLALRSRGGERQEEGDFLAGFRLALGSREELLQQELLKAEEDLARLRHQLDKIEKEKESLEDILGSLNREVLEARKTRNADKEALAQLERAVVTAEAQRQEMKERLTKNESSHQEASETQKKQWSMELESEQALRAESEHRWEMLSEELQRQKEELQEEYRRLQAAYHALEEHLDSDLEEALAESKRKATEAVEQVTALEDEKKQLKEEMNSMALKAQKELGEMRGELEKAATLKLEQVEKDLEEAQAGLRDQEALAAEEANLLQEAQEETTKLKEQLMKLEVDRIALEQQFQEDVKKVESEFKSKMFAAEEEAKQAKAGQSKLEGQISALRKEAEERVHLLTNDLKSEKELRVSLEKQLEEDARKVEADLQNKTSAANEEARLLKAEKRKLESQISIVRKEAEESINKLSSDLKSEKELRVSLEKQMEEDAGKVEADLQNKTSAADEARLLKAEKRKLESQISVVRKKAEESINKLSSDLKSEKELRVSLEKQLEEEVNKVEAILQSRTLTVAEETKLLKAEKRKLQSQISVVRKEADERMKLLTNDLDAEQARRATLEKQLKEEVEKGAPGHPALQLTWLEQDRSPDGVPMAIVPVTEWPEGASLGDAEVDALHVAHHAQPRQVLGCHRLKSHESNEEGDLFVFRVWHQSLERDWEAEDLEVLLQLEGVSPPVPMRRRCAWLYEAVLRLPADWIPDEDDAAQAPVGGVLRLPRYQVLIPEQDHPLHDAFGYVGFLLAEVEIDQFQSGHFLHVADALGCHCVCAGGVYGLRFATWAPRAVFVSVVGDWNNWDGRACPMAKRFRAGKDGGFCGLWEIFVPFGELSDVPFGQKYGFKIHTLAGTDLVKMDPYAQEMEVPSDLYHSPVFNASVISSCDDSYRAKPFEWSDEAWMQAREERGQVNTALLQPMAIYEVHLSSFRRGANGELMNYRDMAKQLVEHVKALNFNWVELMALAHHPFQGSWGYQVSGYYSCYSLLGSPDDLKYLINQLHEAKIGVIMDFVPAHFCKDACSFGDFDGTATFEYEDPREGEQRQWGTKVFNFRRNEVRSFLLGAALFWADRYHIDGFRCDAVSSMIYRNFGKSEGEWIRNEHGGDSNLEAVSLLRELNNSMKEFWPGVIMIAEESTAWEGVTSLRPASSSLGFDLKWDLGWMNDTLIYLEEPAWNKPSNHDKLTWRATYMQNERYVVPLSHDEVANMKGSMIEKMGKKENLGFYERVRLLCALYGYQASGCGRPLLFMGQEYGQGREWNCYQSLDWHEGEEPVRRGLCVWLSDLMAVYKCHKPLHMGDDQPHQRQFPVGCKSFEWVENNPGACVIAFCRHWKGERPVMTICNFGSQYHHGYTIGSPYWGGPCPAGGKRDHQP
ncbi:unnamed protein product [Durusdinium trenchii]|uniref:Glycosyl hydrolase family 13 catalytic domain-containing protein n=2 Tax=Durusdinium trenchii TaxID=1381693 RepID=A0ABP0PM77_9DINO